MLKKFFSKLRSSSSDGSERVFQPFSDFPISFIVLPARNENHDKEFNEARSHLHHIPDVMINFTFSHPDSKPMFEVINKITDSPFLVDTYPPSLDDVIAAIRIVHLHSGNVVICADIQLCALILATVRVLVLNHQPNFTYFDCVKMLRSRLVRSTDNSFCQYLFQHIVQACTSRTVFAELCRMNPLRPSDPPTFILDRISISGMPVDGMTSFRPNIMLFHHDQMIFTSMSTGQMTEIEMTDFPYDIPVNCHIKQNELVFRLYHSPPGGAGQLLFSCYISHALAVTDSDDVQTAEYHLTMSLQEFHYKTPGTRPQFLTLTFIYRQKIPETEPSSRPKPIPESLNNPAPERSNATELHHTSSLPTSAVEPISSTSHAQPSSSLPANTIEQPDVSNDEEFARQLQQQFEQEEREYQERQRQQQQQQRQLTPREALGQLSRAVTEASNSPTSEELIEESNEDNASNRSDPNNNNDMLEFSAELEEFENMLRLENEISTEIEETPANIQDPLEIVGLDAEDIDHVDDMDDVGRLEPVQIISRSQVQDDEAYARQLQAMFEEEERQNARQAVRSSSSSISSSESTPEEISGITEEQLRYLEELQHMSFLEDLAQQGDGDGPSAMLRGLLAHRSASSRLHSLPVSSVSSSMLGKECMICKGDFESGENVKTLPCLHIYHAECADNWLRRKPTCPVCLTRIDAEFSLEGESHT